MYTLPFTELIEDFYDDHLDHEDSQCNKDTFLYM